MALDFPASPTNGQVYGSYVYNSTVGAWQAREDSATVATISTVLPSSANPGDIWYDSDDGTSYIYYDDGTSAQWVELLSSGLPLLDTKADIAGATFTGNVTAPRFISTQATGTAPLTVSSTTAVTNLNADLLDGQHASAFSPVAGSSSITTVGTIASGTWNGSAIPIANGGTGATTLSGAQTNLQIPLSPNYLINGAFDIWQRGTSFTSSGYGADRWYHPISNATVSQETLDLPAGFRFGIRYTTTATGFSQFNQAIERDIVIGLRGKTVTMSGWIKISGSYLGNWVSQALFSNSTDAYASVTTLVPGSNKNVASAATTSWTRFTNTFTVPSDAVGLKIENLPDTQSGTGVTVRMAGLQLEEGAVATTFRRNAPNIQAELAACQRYYRRSYVYAAGGTGGSGGDAWIVAVQFPVPMRISPVVAWISGGTAMDGTADKPITGLYGTPYRNGTVDGVEILYKGATAFAGSARPVTVREALTEFSAEL